MKKLIILIVVVFFAQTSFAQSPNKMSYQAVIRDANNSLITSQSVGIKISILQGAPEGSAVYIETQTPSTNSNGLISIEIGRGNVVSGIFDSIDWANDTFFVKTETDPTGGTSYSITGISQLLSVPYSFYSNVSGSSINDLVNDADADTTNELQNLSLTGTSVNLTKANSIDLSSVIPWKYNSNNDTYYNYGNVGIGTNFPNEKLTIAGLTNGTAGRTFLKLKNNSSDTHSAVIFKLEAGNNSYFTGIYHHSDSYSASQGYNGVGVLWNHGNGLNLRASGAGKIRFETDISTSTIERMIIDSNGNIGIGTSVPESKLQITAGDVYIESINSGVIMTSPNGQCWRMTVDNSGNPVFSGIACP